MSALLFLIQGAALGLSAGATPGPLQTFLISETLQGGWRRGAPVCLAPLISDLPIVILVMWIIEQFPASLLRWLNLGGGLFVLYLALKLFQQWRQTGRQALVAQPNPAGSLRQGVLMNFLSPGPYLFWALVNGPLLRQALSESILHGLAFLGGFYGVFIAAMFSMVLLFHQARRLGPRVVHGLLLVSVLVLSGFGVLLIGRAVFG